MKPPHAMQMRRGLHQLIDVLAARAIYLMSLSSQASRLQQTRHDMSFSTLALQRVILPRGLA